MSNWTYVITTGEMFSPDHQLAGKGYSGGNLGQNPEGVNNPADEGLPSIGPLPEGWYTISCWVSSAHTGPLSGLLVPDATNLMHGRSGFRIHGDSIAHPGCASEGCIIMPHDVRLLMSKSLCQRLQVLATLS